MAAEVEPEEAEAEVTEAAGEAGSLAQVWANAGIAES